MAEIMPWNLTFPDLFLPVRSPSPTHGLIRITPRHLPPSFRPPPGGPPPHLRTGSPTPPGIRPRGSPPPRPALPPGFPQRYVFSIQQIQSFPYEWINLQISFAPAWKLLSTKTITI